jgi:hypothetical protein
MPRIFISYRRADSQIVAGRIYDRLEKEFGGENVFKDVDDIPLGQDFRSVIEREIGQSDVMMIVIGSKWLNIPDAEGNRRLDDPNDPVRFEIETGLKNDAMLIIPLLVDNAPMPGSNDLPKSMAELAYKNAAVVRHDPDFRRDMTRLIKDLDFLREQEKVTLEREKKAAQRATQKTLAIAGGIFVILIVAVLFLISSRVIQLSPTPQPTLDDRAVAMQLLTFTAEAQLAQSATPTINATASIEAILTQFISETDAANATATAIGTATAGAYTDTPTASPTSTDDYTATANAQGTLNAQATLNVRTNTPPPSATSTFTPTLTPTINVRATYTAQAVQREQAQRDAQATVDAQATLTVKAIPTATATPTINVRATYTAQALQQVGATQTAFGIGTFNLRATYTIQALRQARATQTAFAATQATVTVISTAADLMNCPSDRVHIDCAGGIKGQVHRNDVVAVYGRTNNGDWYLVKVKHEFDNVWLFGWISSTAVSFEGDLSTVPILNS